MFGKTNKFGKKQSIGTTIELGTIDWRKNFLGKKIKCLEGIHVEKKTTLQEKIIYWKKQYSG